MRRNVRKRNIRTSTSKKMRVAYVATFPLHCFNYFCTLTETSQYTRPAHFCLSTYACYVYERSVALFIVDGKQAWPRCGIFLYSSHSTRAAYLCFVMCDTWKIMYVGKIRQCVRFLGINVHYTLRCALYVGRPWGIPSFENLLFRKGSDCEANRFDRGLINREMSINIGAEINLFLPIRSIRLVLFSIFITLPSESIVQSELNIIFFDNYISLVCVYIKQIISFDKMHSLFNLNINSRKRSFYVSAEMDNLILKQTIIF